MSLFSRKPKIITQTVDLVVREDEKPKLQRIAEKQPPVTAFGVNCQISGTSNVHLVVYCNKFGYCGRLPLSLSNEIMRKCLKGNTICCDFKVLDYVITDKAGEIGCRTTIQILPFKNV